MLSTNSYMLRTNTYIMYNRHQNQSQEKFHSMKKVRLKKYDPKKLDFKRYPINSFEPNLRPFLSLKLYSWTQIRHDRLYGICQENS